jgi:2-oxoglutarate dehydrogenase dihydrolipoamide succinyltransferase (E2 component)
MPTKVIMPQLGESVVEGTITKWLKTKGEKVEEYEPLLEVNTDKVDSEIPSPASGVLLDILVEEGTTIQAGTLLAWVGYEGEDVPEGGAAPDVIEEPKPKAEMSKMDSSPPEPVRAGGDGTATIPGPGRDRALGFISPVVARIASEQNVDLFQVKGSGKGGRITKKDVLAYIEGRGVAAPRDAPPVPGSISASGTTVAVPPPATSIQPGEVLPLNPVRQAIADHMVRSKHTSPHVTTVMEVDFSRVVADRQANKDVFARDGVRLTYTAYFVAATVSALKAYPIVNSSWSDEGVLIHPAINIGMATSLGEEGLIVPVIKNADQLSLLGLARSVNDLANRARAKQLQPDEVKDGTFTITNHGISGSLFATPIINQPQCGILGIGAIQKRVVVVGDAIAIRPMVYVSLTFDHRILDGAVADYFLAKVVESLQDW